MQKVKRSSHKAAVSAALSPNLRKYFIISLFTASFCLFTWIAFYSVTPQLPSEKQPLLFYSNQVRNNLKLVFLRAIESAQSSIFLIIYGLTDQDILAALQKKATEGIEVRVFYDKGGSKNLSERLPTGCAYPIKSSGLMHKKILVVDDKEVFLGSANLTETSLRVHDNLVIGCYHSGLAHYIKTTPSPFYPFELQGQPLEVWSLPEQGQSALSKVIQEIQKAERSIKVCMFTFTNKEIVKALLEAKGRGVTVDVAFDYYSAKGSSKTTLEILQQHGIQTVVSKGGKLLHHKWCLIDEKTLILGSTNWTAAAFAKNDDCLIFLENLVPSQLNLINQIWNTLETNKR